MALPNIPLRDSRQGALLLATDATLKSIPLPGLQQTRVYIRKRLWDSGLKDKTPCIIIAPAAKGVDYNAGEIGNEYMQYGVAIAFVAAGNYDVTDATMGVQLLWSERAAERFLNQRNFPEMALPNPGDECYRANVIPPSETFLEAAAKVGWDAQYLIVRYEVIQQRIEADA